MSHFPVTLCFRLITHSQHVLLSTVLPASRFFGCQSSIATDIQTKSIFKFATETLSPQKPTTIISCQMPWTTTHRRRKSYSQQFGRPVLLLILLVLAVNNISSVAAFTGAPPSMASSSSFIDKLALILVRNRKQLVVRTRGKEAFFTPGGKREVGESDIDALCRECKEELTINLKRNTIQPYGIFQAQAFGKPPGTMVRMTCYTVDDYDGTLQANEEIDELKWIDSTFEHKYLTVTGIQILEDLKSKNLID